MSWRNVRLILFREIRDQLRDRRTLFMIAVLPLFLYPLLGMSFLQIGQFMLGQRFGVRVVGGRGLGDPPLFENGRFSGSLFGNPKDAQAFDLSFAPREPGGTDAAESAAWAEACRGVEAGRYDAAIYFQPDFARRLDAFRRSIYEGARAGAVGSPQEEPPPVPDVKIHYDPGREKSSVANELLTGVLDRWSQQVGEATLAEVRVPPSAIRPVKVQSGPPSAALHALGVSGWAKILPVLLVLWALTGAFYPAVDLCAGEKERGTLETLLSSPAQRSEIVLGKLATIMLFSMVTAVLNLVSMGVTGWLAFGQFARLGPPPAMAVVWLALALVPVSAVFSALALALAALARSTKEGQYYLIPLLLVTMPLVVLPVARGMELNLGNSLIPVTGVVLLLRSLLEGEYWQSLQFLPTVAAVTLGGCLLSIRWAVDQFNSESVLFRESERFDVGLWMRHLVHDRQPTPTVAAAVFCGVLILLVRFFMGVMLPQWSGLKNFVVLAVVTQLVVIATPALLMTVLFTSSPRRTLLLRLPAWYALPGAALLAVFLQPAVNAAQQAVTGLYPLDPALEAALKGLFRETPTFWQLLLVVAVLPAVCEELAFRGFILSGFRHLGYRWRAIIYSALFFGFSHAILQQSLVACLVGVVIGLLAVQTGSIWPGMIYHLLHNSLVLAVNMIPRPWLTEYPPLGSVLIPAEGGGVAFAWPVVLVSSVAALAILLWFYRLPYARSSEEMQQEAILGVSGS